jgi:hypothetical protein
MQMGHDINDTMKNTGRAFNRSIRHFQQTKIKHGRSFSHTFWVGEYTYHSLLILPAVLWIRRRRVGVIRGSALLKSRNLRHIRTSALQEVYYTTLKEKMLFSCKREPIKYTKRRACWKGDGTGEGGKQTILCLDNIIVTLQINPCTIVEFFETWKKHLPGPGTSTFLNHEITSWKGTHLHDRHIGFIYNLEIKINVWSSVQ